LNKLVTPVSQSEAQAHKDYEKLKTVLNQLLDDISVCIGNGSSLSITPALEALSRYVTAGVDSALLLTTDLYRGIKLETERLSGKPKRKTIMRYAEAKKDVEEVVECYKRVRILLERLQV
jgi:hypothetical protein